MSSNFKEKTGENLGGNFNLKGGTKNDHVTTTVRKSRINASSAFVKSQLQ